MSKKNTTTFITKYPLSIRVLHLLRALIILGLIASGWYMTGLPESKMDIAMFLYPNHKQFGVLIFLFALVHLALRLRYKAVLPHTPPELAPWEKFLSHVIHRLIIALTLLVPLLGYAMSSSYTQSAGVPFFFVEHLPGILPKNDQAFEVFQSLHAYAAYALLFCIVLHIAGAFKHRLLDKKGPTDVLPRMF